MILGAQVHRMRNSIGLCCIKSLRLSGTTLVYANASIDVQVFSQVLVCKHDCMHVAIPTNIQIFQSVGMTPPIITYFKMCNNFSCKI